MNRQLLSNAFIEAVAKAETERFIRIYKPEEESKPNIAKDNLENMKRAAWLLTAPINEAEKYFEELHWGYTEEEDPRVAFSALELLWNLIFFSRAILNREDA